MPMQLRTCVIGRLELCNFLPVSILFLYHPNWANENKLNNKFPSLNRTKTKKTKKNQTDK